MPDNQNELSDPGEPFEWVMTLGSPPLPRLRDGLPALFDSLILPCEVTELRPMWGAQRAALRAANNGRHRLIALPSKSRDQVGRIGTLVEITDVQSHGDVVAAARLEGIRRVVITEVVRHRPYPIVISQACRRSESAKDHERRIAWLVESALKGPKFTEDDVDLQFLGPSDKADRLATLLHLSVSNKRASLRAPTLEVRLQLLEDQARDVGDAVRKFGAEEPDTPEEVKLPDEVKRAIEREKRDGSGWHDRSQMIVNVLTDLHWEAPPQQPIDLARARQLLDASHAGMDDVKEAVIDHLAVQEWRRHKKLANTGDGLSLCLVGPPGTGKTSIAAAIAEASHRKLEQIPLGDVDDVFLAGSDRAYAGSRPGEVLRRLRSAACHPSELVFLLDEVDKISQSPTRSPLSVLLALFDPTQNRRWMDQCLGSVPIDLSSALFIATANDEREIAPPLRDRMQIIRVRAYTRAEQRTIATDYILPKLLTRLGVESELHVTPDALARIVDDSPATGGMRQVEQRLTTVLSRGIRRHLRTRRAVSVDTTAVTAWLHPRANNGSIGFRAGVDRR